MWLVSPINNNASRKKDSDEKTNFSFLLLALFLSSSIAAEKDYRMCSITGFLLGEKEKFVADVAMRILLTKGLLMTEKYDPDLTCDALIEEARRIGAAYYKRGKGGHYNWKIRDKAQLGAETNKFADKVYDAIISNMDYK